MSKKQQVLELDDGTRTTAEIARLVGCDPAYVRVCRQRKQGVAPAEKTYQSKRRERVNALYHAVPFPERTRRQREAYAQARELGATCKQARSKAMYAVLKASRRRFYEVTP